MIPIILIILDDMTKRNYETIKVIKIKTRNKRCFLSFFMIKYIELTRFL